MHAYLAAGVIDLVNEIVRDRISLFWDKFERRVKAAGALHFDNFRAKIAAGFRFHIMSHDAATRVAFRPIPDKRDFRQIQSLQDKLEGLVKKIFDREINRPGREIFLVPSLESDPLQILSETHREKRPERVISLSNDRARSGLADFLVGLSEIAFKSKGIDNRIEITRCGVSS